MKKLLFVLAIGAFAACGGNEEAAPAETPATEAPAATTTEAPAASGATTPAATGTATPQ